MSALAAARDHIRAAFGADYLPEKGELLQVQGRMRRTRTKHPSDLDAVRPRTVRPFFTMDQYSLYRQIWNRLSRRRYARTSRDDCDVTARTASLA